MSEPEDKLSELEDSESDHVDQVRALWAQVRPDLDTSSIAVIARLGRVAAYMDAGINARLADFGLTRNAWDVLASLRRSGPPYRLSPTELYRALMRSSGAITHRLAELQHAGLITRVSDPADGRGLLVELTREGLALVDRVAPAHLANERELLEPLTEDEQATLAALLRKRLLAFEQTQPAPPPSGVGGRRRRHRKRRR